MINIHKKILLTLVGGIMVHALAHASEDIFAVEENKVGFTQAMLDPSQPSGLNLQEIVNDQQYRRRSGLGTGFSTDVLGVAQSKETVVKTWKELNALLEERIQLENSLLQQKKKKKRKLIEEQIENINASLEAKKRALTATQDCIIMLNGKISEVSGVDVSLLGNIPTFSDMPKHTILPRKVSAPVILREARKPVERKSSAPEFRNGQIQKARESLKTLKLDPPKPENQDVTIYEKEAPRKGLQRSKSQLTDELEARLVRRAQTKE